MTPLARNGANTLIALTGVIYQGLNTSESPEQAIAVLAIIKAWRAHIFFPADDSVPRAGALSQRRIETWWDNLENMH